MRTSQRSEILEAALRVMNAAEGGDITLDAVAHEAGLTKPGLLYHFRNRDVLLAAIVDHAAANVENDMTATLGKPLENANATERLLSYVHVAAHGPPSAPSSSSGAKRRTGPNSPNRGLRGWAAGSNSRTISTPPPEPG